MNLRPGRTGLRQTEIRISSALSSGDRDCPLPVARRPALAGEGPLADECNAAFVKCAGRVACAVSIDYPSPLLAIIGVTQPGEKIN